MIKNSFIIVSLLVLFFSCKKDAAITLPAISTFNNSTATSQDTMLPLAVGNYWIYQKSQDDSSGTYTMQNQFDSLYIEKDSVIFGNLYYKFKHANNYFLDYFSLGASFSYIWIRDSSNFLITYPRTIALDPINLTDTVLRFSDTTSGFISHFSLVPDTFSNRHFIIGQFSGLWMKGYSFIQPPFAFRNGQHYFNAYVKNIGLVRTRRTFSGCAYHCRFSQHLIRYHLN
jgi:hypothetical protein